MSVKKYVNSLSLDDLINAESAIGRTLFGEIPAGHQREFFKTRQNVWIWYENWTDTLGIDKEMTIRYEVRPAGVFKRYNGGEYERIKGVELENFKKATSLYLKLIKEHLYQ